MAIYVIEINERVPRGKAFKTLLESETTAKLISIKEYEDRENKVIIAEMKKAARTPLLGVSETKAEITRLKSRFKK